ncbi:SDR family oxidoreductase [Sagittula sp. SSi028]|uniref:SDR family oxidoreductase n=1 Tax=Sagittula sp. SSi028 TaxID=3400636 RepID=UPI003AF85862
MKVVIITGASEGIGAELAAQMGTAERGDLSLVLVARRAEQLEAVARRIRPHGTDVLCIPADLREAAACRDVIAQTIARFGRLDVLVNNAGMSAHANLIDLAEQDDGWQDRLMTINYWSVLWLTQAALPHLLQTKGQVVGVSSVAGLVGVPGRTAYCASKFAMTGFLEALRAEMGAKGLRVTLAYPGTIDTNLRKQGYTAGGVAPGVSMLRDARAMPVDRCARLIYDGMRRGKRDVLMTPRDRIGRWLRLIAPGLVDRLAMANVKPEYRP